MPKVIISISAVPAKKAAKSPDAVKVTSVPYGVYGIKKKDVLARLNIRDEYAEDLFSSKLSVSGIDEALAQGVFDKKTAKSLKDLVAAGKPLWYACGYESNSIVLLASAPVKLKSKIRDSRDFEDTTVVLETDRHEALLFCLNH